MTSSSNENEIDRAWGELRATLDAARSMVRRVRSEPLQTQEERDYLQRASLEGELGRDMQEIARHVEAGETTWAEVFQGESPYSSLLGDHLDTMRAEHGEQIRIALAEDPTFDPDQVAPELEEPVDPDPPDHH